MTPSADTERLERLKLEAQRVQRAARTVLRALRDDADLTRAQLAQRVGYDEEQIKNIELGHRSIRLEDVVTWALALDKDPERILLEVLRWKEATRRKQR